MLNTTSPTVIPSSACGKPIAVGDSNFNPKTRAIEISPDEKFLLMGIFAATVFGVRVFDRVLAGDERVRTAALRLSAVIAGIAAIAAAVSLTPLHPRIFIAVWRPRPAELAEMLTRLGAMLPVNVRGMWIGTFHGLCNRFLRAHWKLAGSGHGWPGESPPPGGERLAGPQTQLIRAADEVWAFVSRFRTP